MASLSMADSLILMVLALVVFGPRRLPQIGRQIGKLMYEFRKASNDFKFQMEEELRNAEEADRRKKEEERQRALAAVQPAPQLEQSTSAVAAESSASVPDSSGTDPVSATPASPASTPDASENLYPYESRYTETDLTFKTEQPIESSPSTEPEAAAPIQLASSPELEAAAPVTNAAPRIMPPSTGQTVAAEPPGRQFQASEAAAPNSLNPGNATESVVPEAERSEPATHHG
jgi:sec-independent protein translocase protein TatB